MNLKVLNPFLKEELPELIENISELYSSSLATKSSSMNSGNPSTNGQNSINYSTSTFASKLSVSSGTDLILASAAYLHFSKNKNTFQRNELLEAAKLASGYYKDSVSSNLTSYLQTLVKNGKFNEISKDVYALSQDEINSIKAQIG